MNSRMLLFAMIGSLTLFSGCSSEPALPVAGRQKPVSIQGNAGLSNPLKVEPGPAKQLARRGAAFRRLGR